MKKTYPANISGKIYYIDEDAYNLLQDYLTQLRSSFPGEEGREIVCDIEGRVAEIFEDKIAAGHSVVTLEDVNNVIARMGRPEQISDDGAEHHESTNDEEQKEKPLISINLPTRKRLYRDVRNKVFGGVLSGLANYLNWDCTIMRLLMVVLALCSYVWPWLIIYLILWMIIPPANTSRQILEMHGRPVTVDGVGRTVLDSNATPPPYRPDGTNAVSGNGSSGFWSFMSDFFKVLGKGIMVLLLVIGCVVGVTAIVFVILGGAAMLLGLCYGSYEVASNMGVSLTMPLFKYELWAMILAGMVVLIPCVALVWTACVMLFNKRGASTAVVVSAFVIEVFLIAALVVMCNLVDGAHTMCMLATVASVYIA